MKKSIKTAILISAILAAGRHPLTAQEIKTVAAPLTDHQIRILKQELTQQDSLYDPLKKMIWAETKEKHYHSDLDSGARVHDTRASAQYAAALMHTQDPTRIRRGIDIVQALLPLQEQDNTVAYVGVWPYYPEDPLKNRTAPVDYNWADFMAVSLIDVAITAKPFLSPALQQQLEAALKRAARSIIKRDVKADYTNICIMDIYVCYMVGNLYQQPDIRQYARRKLAYFYQFTAKNKGFTEFNSPTYTIVALDELLRMKEAIRRPEDKAMADSLYYTAWRIVADHFHQPSGQWAGPYLRTYSDLLTPALKHLFFYASHGRIDLPGAYQRQPEPLRPHCIPEDLIARFLSMPARIVSIDTFTVGRWQQPAEKSYADTNSVIRTADITGRLFMTDNYALGSVNQGYLWNQCRPVMMHWGDQAHPRYLRLRFLNDDYDFASVHIKSAQDSSHILSVLNLAINGGRRHPTIDQITDSCFRAKDLRLRIEIGGDTRRGQFSRAKDNTNTIILTDENITTQIHLPYISWAGLSGHWEFGQQGTDKWADYVLYSGPERAFDMRSMKEAVIGFALDVYSEYGPKHPAGGDTAVRISAAGRYLELSKGHLLVRALKKPADAYRIKNDFTTEIQ